MITRDVLLSAAAAVALLAGTASAAEKKLADAAPMSEARVAALSNSAKPMLRMLSALPSGAKASMKAVERTGKMPAVRNGEDGPADNRDLVDPTGPQPSGMKSEGGIAPQNYGSGNLNSVYHYSDALVDSKLLNRSPIRQTGEFLFQASDYNWYRCSASLIAKSIIALAGHCVHDGGNGNSGWIRQGTFTPGKGTGSPPYGYATANHLFTTGGWFGTGNLDAGYDVALVVLNKRNGTSKEIGSDTGTYSFCYSNCLQPYWHFTQLGYPGNYYGGDKMTSSQHLSRSDNRDYIYGTGMQGGSSGGPHVANIGEISDSSSNKGQWANRNVVFAVTSWGYIDESLKIQGASTLSGPNNSNNFKQLYNSACNVSRSLHGSGSCSLL